MHEALSYILTVENVGVDAFQTDFKKRFVALLAYEFRCMRPSAPAAWGLKLLLHEALSHYCMRP